MSVRDGILATAVELFAERGYRSTSITDVADAAGVSRAAIQYHFRRKEDLFSECAWTVFGHSSAHVADAIVRSGPSLNERLAAAFAATVTWATTHPGELHFFIRVTSDRANHPHLDVPHLFRHRYLPAWEPIVRELRDRYGPAGEAAIALVRIHLIGAIGYAMAAREVYISLYGESSIDVLSHMNSERMARAGVDSLMTYLEGVQCDTKAGATPPESATPSDTGGAAAGTPASGGPKPVSRTSGRSSR
jgi:TetR/AcrR family transcriptional regulator